MERELERLRQQTVAHVMAKGRAEGAAEALADPERVIPAVEAICKAEGARTITIMSWGMTGHLTRGTIDLMVPEHSVLRYQEGVVCRDDNRLGGFARDFADKEWRCKRCCLLDLLDGNAPPHAAVALEVSGCGNVR